MNNFTLYTDSACDLTQELLEELGVKCIDMTFTLSDADRIYTDNEIPLNEFYGMMRNGTVARTSAINTERFKEAFEPELKEGKDVLYLGFSSGLSTTYNCSKIAADELLEKYPDRKIITVDTLAASGGFGLLVYLTAQYMNKGADMERTAKYAKEKIMHISHWFTVDDLVYLKRGGRISPTVAFVGGLLGIKPVLHTDNEGHLVNVSKARGRKASITALADRYTETAVEPSKGTVFICHADCKDDAKELAGLLKRRHRITTIKIM
ncbi:MAG: DegV family protein, partial [Ruminococcus sp.]|nr:DegV family protein [Ruminococcus sp.]